MVIGDKFGEKKMVVMEPDMQHRMPWYDRYEASSGKPKRRHFVKFEINTGNILLRGFLI